MSKIATMAYSFAALRGQQAGRAFYTISCPLSLVPRILSQDDDTLPPDSRRQRQLNTSRIPAIARYLVQNSQNYVLPALVASIDAEVRYTPFEQSRDLGTLEVPMDATILVNDGQHRLAAITRALKENRTLGEDTVTVILFVDRGLEASQQMFADLNFHSAKPSKSLAVVYDHRNEGFKMARNLANETPFRGLVEFEKSSIAKSSGRLFTITAIDQATRVLLGLGTRDVPTSEQCELAWNFWIQVGESIPDWEAALQGTIPASELRQSKVHAHAVVLEAIGTAGSHLLATYPDHWMGKTAALSSIDWSRSNPVWEGKCMIGGVMQKNSACVIATADYLLQAMGVNR